MTLDHRQKHLESVRAGLSVLLYPIQYAVHAPFRAGRWLMETLATRESLLDENARLREQQLLTDARMARFEALEAENARLRRLLDSSVRVAERVLVAEIIAVDMDPFSRRILLNKGLKDGIYEGQPLIDAQGVMGQIEHVNQVSANALLITDPGHALSVQINRNGQRAVAVGRGASDTLELLHLPNTADVVEGDLVVASGLGQRFPAGYPVGTVSSVQSDTGRPFASVVVVPSASLQRNREVLLIWPQQHTEDPGNDAAVDLPGAGPLEESAE